MKKKTSVKPKHLDSVQVCEILKITPNNLRWIVHDGQLTPQGRMNRRSYFLAKDVEKLRIKRQPFIPSADA